MTNKDTKLIYEAYIISEDEVAPDDRAKLEAELADLKSQMDYYNHVDDHSKWQEETPKREKTLARISDIGNILNASSPPEEQEHPELEGKVWKWDPPMAAPEDEAEDEEVYDDLVAGDIPDKADGRGHLVTPAIMAMYNIDPNADMDAVAKYLNL